MKTREIKKERTYEKQIKNEYDPQFVILNIVDPLIISIMANYFYDSLKQR